MLSRSPILCGILVLFFISNCKEKGKSLPQLLNDQKSSIVLIGERHDYLNKFDVQLRLLKKINAADLTKKVTDIVFEQPTTTGISVINFFASGDSLRLKSFLQAESKLLNKDEGPLYQFYLDLYTYHQSLPYDDRFELHFVDVESLKSNNLSTWIALLSETTNRELKGKISAISYDLDDYNSITELTYELQEICLQEELLENHIHYNTLKKIQSGFSSSNRDEYMYKRIEEILNSKDAPLIFGQFGDWHVCRGNDGSLASLFANDAVITVHLNFNNNTKQLKIDQCMYDMVLNVSSKKGKFLR